MKKKICFVVAIPGTAQSFLRDHIAALSIDYDVYLVANIKDKNDVAEFALTDWHQVRIERGISLMHDLAAVWKLYRYFSKMKFDAVHSVTPKAGLVCALASWLARIKHRTHIFTGQVWATRTGAMRWLLKLMDHMIVSCDNHILVDGKSQRSFLVKEKILREGQAEVFHKGSISGVNIERFTPDANIRGQIRQEIGIGNNVINYIFLGRLNHDKGIGELLEAYNRLAGEVDDAFLLLVGYDEENCISQLHQYPNIAEGKNFHYYGLTPCPEKVLNAGDVFVLPTYREGFGTSVLEAASMGLPCICSDAYGVLDAYTHETGLQCHVGDVDSLYKCMKEMYEHPEKIKEMGKNSRDRVLEDFDARILTKCWVDYYHELLGQ